jgi:hypothetical protein
MVKIGQGQQLRTQTSYPTITVRFTGYTYLYGDSVTNMNIDIDMYNSKLTKFIN